MAKKKGAISTETGIKNEIIIIILENDGPVEESQIRKQLNKDQGNINRHLHDLKELGCIGLFQGKKDFRNCNYWNIENIKNLRSIRKKLTNIPLNVYDKALDLMENFRNHYSNSPYDLKFRIELKTSLSFFDECLENTDEALNAKGHKMERLGGDFEKYERINASLDKVYTEHIIPISIDSNIWLNAYDQSVNSSLKVNVDQDLLKRSFDVEISKETFGKVLEGMRVYGLQDSRDEWSRRIFREVSAESSTVSAEKVSKILGRVVERIAQKIKELDEENFQNIGNYRLSEEISVKLSYLVFLKLLKEIPEKLLDMSEETLTKILENVFMEIFYNIYTKVMEIPNELFRNMAEIWWQQLEDRVKIPDIIFRYCVYRDIDLEIDNPLANEFISKLNKLEASHKVKNPLCNCSDCSKFYIEFDKECIEYCKKSREEVRKNREEARSRKKSSIQHKKSVGNINYLL